MPLLHDFVPLEQRFDVVAQELLAGDDFDLGGRLYRSAARAVSAVEVGPPRFQDEILVIPLRFMGGDAPFDMLDADLRVEPVESDHTHLFLTGSYQASSPNRREARVRQRLVESWARAFLTQVSGSIGAPVR